ncbi:hypothetical protein CMUS01_04481 [Colletotrichum musicola]|uniref:Uncharacterized protein n=1 Tax=Colletotrichum musicola TaxID=2175873 RepID=A0A8H6KW87_9PEZI|nr:hypothetical protein CMUS01_04481 [Colletotrichum musicola]
MGHYALAEDNDFDITMLLSTFYDYRLVLEIWCAEVDDVSPNDVSGSMTYLSEMAPQVEYKNPAATSQASVHFSSIFTPQPQVNRGRLDIRKRLQSSNIKAADDESDLKPLPGVALSPRLHLPAVAYGNHPRNGHNTEAYGLHIVRGRTDFRALSL